MIEITIELNYNEGIPANSIIGINRNEIDAMRVAYEKNGQFRFTDGITV